MSDEKLIDYKRAVELFGLAIKEKGPDFVYEKPDGHSGCYYSDVPTGQLFREEPTEPGCAWGWALALSEMVTLEEVARFGGNIVSVMYTLDYDLTEKAEAYMSSAQDAQDRGYTWGEAHVHAVQMAAQHYLSDS